MNGIQSYWNCNERRNCPNPNNKHQNTPQRTPEKNGGSENQRWQKPPLLSDNRRGYARVTPVALSRNGVPGLATHTIDQYPGGGLGICDDLESCSHFAGYAWSDWTTKNFQQLHIDDALKAMIDQPVRSGTGTTMALSQPNAQFDSSTSVENKGSGASAFSGAPPSLNHQRM